MSSLPGRAHRRQRGLRQTDGAARQDLPAAIPGWFRCRICGWSCPPERFYPSALSRADYVCRPCHKARRRRYPRRPITPAIASIAPAVAPIAPAVAPITPGPIAAGPPHTRRWTETDERAAIRSPLTPAASSDALDLVRRVLEERLRAGRPITNPLVGELVADYDLPLWRVKALLLDLIDTRRRHAQAVERWNRVEREAGDAVEYPAAAAFSLTR